MLPGWALVGLFVTYTKPECWARRVGETAHENKQRIEQKKSDFFFVKVFSIE